MRTQFTEAVLKHLPDQVEVDPNGDWKYSRSYESLPGSIKVSEREGSGDSVFTTEYYSDGVRPRGLGCLADVLKKALDKCKVTDVRVGSLLSK
jgi:hypothetical protein